MRLQAEINGEDHEIEVSRNGNVVTATIDGRLYTVEASEPERDVFLLKADNRVNEAAVSTSDGKTFQIRLDNNDFEIRIVDPKRLRGSATGEDHSDGASEIRTAMPGKVVRIIAPVGTAVEKGDGVIVVEAMKMQNEMKSPKDGVVKTIRAEEGVNVNAGDILAVIE